MLFFLKKLFQALLLPPALIFLLLIISLVLIYLKKKWGKRLLIITIIIFYALSITPVSNLLLRTLENKYPPIQTIPKKLGTVPNYVVVLGGGTLNRDTQLPPTSRLNPSSTARLLEGIRLFNQMDDPVLLTSGGSQEKKPLQSLTCYQMRRLALMLGIEEDRVIAVCGSLDTDDEAEEIKKIIGDQPFYLVTSASHMPRSVYIFEKTGMNPTPAPSDFRGQSKHNYVYSPFFPSTRNLDNSSLAIKEYFGLIFYKLLKIKHQ